MNALVITKKVINVIVTAGTGKIVNDIITNNTDPETVADKVTYTAGSYAIGGLVAAETAKYTDAKIDEMAEKWTEFKQKIRDAKN